MIDYQATYNGVTVGQGCLYGIWSISGLDDWQARNGNTSLPSMWGSQPGAQLVDERRVTLGVQLDDPAHYDGTVDAAFTPPDQAFPAVLLPFTVKFPDRPALLMNCAVTRKARPRTADTEISVVRWLFELTAPDPRLYAAALSTATLAPFTPDTSALDLTAGSGVDLGFDLTAGSGVDLGFDFAGSGGGLYVTCTNNGGVDTYPALTFQTGGGMTAWSVTNTTTGETASFAYTLNAGHIIIADMAGAGTGVATPPITYDGSPNYAIWQFPRIPLRLVSGPNVLRFDVSVGDLAGTCSVAWRDAYL